MNELIKIEDTATQIENAVILPDLSLILRKETALYPQTDDFSLLVGYALSVNET